MQSGFKGTLKVSILTSLVIMLSVLLFQLFPAQIFMLFNASEEMIMIGKFPEQDWFASGNKPGIARCSVFFEQWKSYLSMISLS